MCEMLAFSSPTPLAISRILDVSLLLDEYGIAGFGWGIVWSDGETLHRYRSVDSIRRDLTAKTALSQITMQKGFVHLRRPSLMTTIGHVNVQPYLSPGGDWAFAHNGYLERHAEFRERFASQLVGTSDSEVGFWYWMERLQTNAPLMQSLFETHQALRGNANFMALGRQGDLGVYAGNEENAIYTFRIGDLQLASTGLHSRDNFLFETVFPAASHIDGLGIGQSIVL
ncbi:MAG: hypothetical protein C7B45_16775 [Sulfobacillus acidophilus]|uniref:Glutamine amidotransferase type-2 domain-containing protein n=1 Tax=Sulfobacillus acidophilus TaxID=53633 RepID=A0A2T2WCU2_9FIRM|nr:MAG: hypothetical protein C7B45_16775 [Sulfobacillus acidophilus]